MNTKEYLKFRKLRDLCEFLVFSWLLFDSLSEFTCSGKFKQLHIKNDLNSKNVKKEFAS